MNTFDKKPYRLLRRMVIVLFVCTVLLNTTYGLRAAKGITNEFTGISALRPAPPDEGITETVPDAPGATDTTHTPKNPGKPAEPAKPAGPGTPGVPELPDSALVPSEPADPGAPPKTGDDLDARPWLILLAVCAYTLRRALLR